MTATLRSRLGDAAALLARVVLGVVFIAHGLPKMTDPGGTAQGFEAMGVPLPQFTALLGAAIEVGAGAALLVGFALPAAGLLLALMMASAYFFAHVGDPLVGGFELPLVLGAAALALGFSGGRYSVDSLLPWGRARGRTEAAESVPSA
ncbi:membrane protein [Nocardiopsis terrae]|uniref:Oxidoreductase n=1 Tax=Nocardiopsis terrae TaxID=372655 RepID=A0ABR9HNF1_9ACTN|nr:DoxX family protein [Nocardiopsis terrae]MBE1460549.1 putative oxidoreductase [Nocardiopsis terrae]GHC72036.1 membrane protein [Nocardiopsis terrae]